MFKNAQPKLYLKISTWIGTLITSRVANIPTPKKTFPILPLQLEFPQRQLVTSVLFNVDVRDSMKRIQPLRTVDMCKRGRALRTHFKLSLLPPPMPWKILPGGDMHTQKKDQPGPSSNRPSKSNTFQLIRRMNGTGLGTATRNIMWTYWPEVYNKRGFANRLRRARWTTAPTVIVDKFWVCGISNENVVAPFFQDVFERKYC